MARVDPRDLEKAEKVARKGYRIGKLIGGVPKAALKK